MRCAVHPVRPAVDACPVCARGRCGVDATSAPGGGCAACLGGPASNAPAIRPPGELERAIRGTLAALGVGLLGGFVAQQYVGTEVFAYLSPLVVGVLCGAAAQHAAARDRKGQLSTPVRALAALMALLGVALGFVLEGSESTYGAAALLPYAAAVAGALLWTTPPRRSAGAVETGEEESGVVPGGAGGGDHEDIDLLRDRRG